MRELALIETGDACLSIWILFFLKDKKITKAKKMSLSTFLKDFSIIKAFKETGQKRVYLTEHPGYGNVIIKIGKSQSRQSVKRAKREVEIQRSLNSHYYPKNLDFKIFKDAQFVIIEEFIESTPLSNCYEKFSKPLSILTLLNSIVQGLDLLWQYKIVHRDIKPDNILIKEDGSPVIIDLGIILAIERTDLTHYACSSPCTPAYAAPEQLKNRRAEIDYRTDQFILGIDIMELIMGGIHPFDPAHIKCGNSIPENIINGNWAKEKLDSELFLPLKNLTNRLLAPEPYLRFKNINTLKEEIKKCFEVYK